MKMCSRFHFEDVETGDRLFLGGGGVQEFSTSADPDIEIIVRRAFRTRRFGPVVVSADLETYYLNDYDIIRSV